MLLIIYKTPLHLAIENENVEIVKLLLQNPNVDVNDYAILLMSFNSIHIHKYL